MSDDLTLQGRLFRTDGAAWEMISLWFEQKIYSRQTKDTVNYCVLINRLSELMGDERILLEKTCKCTAGEQFRLAKSK